MLDLLYNYRTNLAPYPRLNCVCAGISRRR